MICPECKSEYRQGFLTCADCGVELVPKLPEVSVASKEHGEPPEYASFVTLLETFDPSYLAFLQSMLQGDGIDYYVLGEDAHWSYMPAPKIIRVREEQAARALELLEELENGSSE